MSTAQRKAILRGTPETAKPVALRMLKKLGYDADILPFLRSGRLTGTAIGDVVVFSVQEKTMIIYIEGRYFKTFFTAEFWVVGNLLTYDPATMEHLS